MKQLPLEMAFPSSERRENFIVSECNALALASIDQWPDWRGNCRALNLVGPSGAGKSHLASMWRSMIQKSHLLVGLQADKALPDLAFYVLDGVASNKVWDEESLFHCFNRCVDDKGGILLLSKIPVGQMDWRLPDLRSRMRAVNVARIGSPDDGLLYALLNKHFLDRQMSAPQEMLSYIVNRMERSFASVQVIASALERDSIAKKKPLSIALARAAFESFS
ncbi:DnaA/Hda family protein [Candidatus Puniceispirillum sp.]|nr:DnaA/Hda family protein [Candidatus Puniceispirillum sp.]